jgi:hypothetical protein
MYVFVARVLFRQLNSCVDKLDEAKRAAQSPLGEAVLNHPEIKAMKGRLHGTMGKLKHRLRSLSPQKKLTAMERED